MTTVPHNPSYNQKNMMMIPKSLPSRRPPRRPASPSSPPSSSSSFTINSIGYTSPRVIDVPAESRLPASVGATSLSYYTNTKQLLASTSPIERKLHRRRPQDHGGRPFKLTKQQITMQTLRDSPPHQRKRQLNGGAAPTPTAAAAEAATSDAEYIVI